MKDLVFNARCPLKPQQLWHLKSERAFHDFNASYDKCRVNLDFEEVFEDKNGHRKTKTTMSSILLANPVPLAMQGVVDGNLITPVITSEWWLDHWDEEHACIFSVQTPSFSDKISIHGKQWLLDDSNGSCLVCTRVKVDCRVPGIGPVIERIIEAGMLKSYTSYETRIPVFIKKHPDVVSRLPETSACDQACQTDDLPDLDKKRSVGWLPPRIRTTHIMLSELSENEQEPQEVHATCGVLIQRLLCCAGVFSGIVRRYRRVSENKARPERVQYDKELSDKCKEIGVVD